MAETPEQTLERLRVEAEAAAAAVTPTPTPAPSTATELPMDTLARLEREGAAQTPAPRIRTTSIAGIPIPEGAQGYIPGAEFLGGFNEAVGNLAGLLLTPVLAGRPPAEGTPERAEYDAASAGGRISSDIARSQEIVQGFLQRLRIVPEDMKNVQTIEAKVGREMVPAVLTAAAMVWGAPTVARNAGSAYMNRIGLATPATIAPSTSPTAEALGRFAAEVATHPATVSRAVIGSQPGMTITRENIMPYVEQALPGTEYPVTAGLTKAAISFGLEMLGSIPSYAIARMTIPVPRTERFNPMTPHGQPILQDQADPATAGQIARVRQVRLMDSIDRMIARTLQAAGVDGLSEAQASRNLRSGLLAARDYARAEVTRAYGEVDNSITGQPYRFRDAVLDMIDDASRNPAVTDNYPIGRLHSIRQQLMAGTDPQGRPIWRDNVPIRELNEIRTTLMRDSDIAAETSVLQPRPNRVLHENIDRLVTDLTGTIESIGMRVDPRFQPAWEYANRAYRLYNDRFRRGPVGELLMVTRQSPFATEGQPIPLGGTRVPPTEVARRLLNPDESARAVINAAARFGRQLHDPAAGATAQARVMRTGDEAIRTMFRDDILEHFMAQETVSRKPSGISDIPTSGSTQRGPVASAVYRAQQWMNKNEPLLAGWTGTTRRLFDTVTRITNLLAARDRMTQSVLDQFLGSNATEVFERALRAPDRAARFSLMHRTFKNNPDFLEGAQRAIIDLVFSGRGADPNVALERLRSGAYREALEALFKNDPARLDRLYDMVLGVQQITGTAVSATQAGGARVLPKEIKLSLGERVSRFAQSQAAHIFGLAFGGVLARIIPWMGSAGSLSLPMRVSRGMRDLVSAAWLGNRPEVLKLMKEAVFDATFEARIRDLAPGNFSQARANLELLNRYLRRLEAVTNQDVDKLLTSNGYRLYDEERRLIREEVLRLRTRPTKGQ